MPDKLLDATMFSTALLLETQKEAENWGWVGEHKTEFSCQTSKVGKAKSSVRINQRATLDQRSFRKKEAHVFEIALPEDPKVRSAPIFENCNVPWCTRQPMRLWILRASLFKETHPHANVVGGHTERRGDHKWHADCTAFKLAQLLVRTRTVFRTSMPEM
mmetsp:Transcript_37118/g.74305  ORF Transcript_37118/g.74305 Transcript_37118/m.74305 type:complete len:160 (+) Transcript_37118:1211-1690(+)